MDMLHIVGDIMKDRTKRRRIKRRIEKYRDRKGGDL